MLLAPAPRTPTPPAAGSGHRSPCASLPSAIQFLPPVFSLSTLKSLSLSSQVPRPPLPWTGGPLTLQPWSHQGEPFPWDAPPPGTMGAPGPRLHGSTPSARTRCRHSPAGPQPPRPGHPRPGPALCRSVAARSAMSLPVCVHGEEDPRFVCICGIHVVIYH